MRGTRLGAVVVRPVRWDGASGRLVMARRLTVRLTLVADAAAVSLSRHRVVPAIEARFAPAFEAMDLEPPAAVADGRLTGDGPAGPGPFQPTFRPTTDGSAVEYVIITSEELAAEFEPLAVWKTRKGVQATIRTIEWIDTTYPNGVDRAERVRFFIRDAYQNWGTLWVLLGGDTDVVPCRYAEILQVGNALPAESIPADYYYMCLDGNWNADGDHLFGVAEVDDADLMPEVWAGRAPCSTPQEARTFVEKTLGYEIEAASGNQYPTSALFMAGWIYPNYHGGLHTEEAVGILSAHAPDFKTVRLYEDPMQSPWPTALPLNKHAAIDSTNNGFGIIHHVGHGFINTMAVGSDSVSSHVLTNADVDNFMNGERRSVVFAINCSSASIDFNAIGERWVKNPNGGGVAYYGSSRNAYVSQSASAQGEWYRTIFEDGDTELGAACALARTPLLFLAGQNNTYRWTVFSLTLLGDPELDVYTGMPAPLSVVHADTLELGSGGLAVTVEQGGAPLAEATVTAWKEGDFYAQAETDAAGLATLDFTAASAGVCALTVHQGSFLPYAAAVTLAEATGPYVVIDQVEVIDDGSGASIGDGDGNADAGETVELRLTVQNGGGGDATAISGVLTLDDPGGHLTLTTDTVDYGTIAAAGSSAGSGQFVIEIAPDVPEAYQPLCTLTLTASEGSWQDVFVLPVRRPYVEHFMHLIDDAPPRGNGNGTVEAGEEIWYTITLRNSGQHTAQGVDGVLRALRRADYQPEPLVTLIDDQASFGDIEPGVEADGDRFEFAVDLALSPSDFVLEASYADLLGQAWAETLDVVAPGVPDSLRSFGTTSSIRLEWTVPEDTDILGYDVYRADQQTGPWQRINEFIAVGSAVFEDIGRESLTAYYYQVVARDSSFNEGPPSAIVYGTTRPPMATGWPNVTGQGIAASLQIADSDGDWTYEVFTASEYQCGWHHDGTEIIDGDGRPYTNGPMNTDGYDASKSFSATPALGDVDGDGLVEILNVGWVTGEVYLWDHLGELLDGWPQPLVGSEVDFNWASPVLADLDQDGDLEVIVWPGKAGGRLHAWHHDGVTEVIDGDNDPATHGVMYRVTGCSYNYSSPAVGDLDGDPELEIVFCTRNIQEGSASIYAINPLTASDVPGWPVIIGGATAPRSVSASPVIVDLDTTVAGNEIVVASELNTGGFPGTVHVFQSDGTPLPGWPQPAANKSQQHAGSTSVGDIDGDGYLDVVYPDSDGELHVWHRNGAPMDGFPVRYMEDRTAHTTETTASIGDIDGDGMMEMVFGDETGLLHGFNHDGTTADGFPIQLDGEARASALLWDIDQDNLIEVGYTGWDQNVYVWDLDSDWNPTLLPWPMFRHDAANTGCFTTPHLPPNVGVEEPVLTPVPVAARVLPPYPNPFNPQTRLAYDVPGAGPQRVRITIHDVQGRRVRTLVDGGIEPGRHQVTWDGRVTGSGQAATGVYFYRVEIGDYTAAGKLTLVK
jgi:hypothetical protein